MKEATIKINVNTQNAINSIDELNNEFNGTLSTIGDLRIASQKLSEQLESTPVGTAKFQELQQSLIDVNGQLKNYELSIEALDNEQLASEIRSVVGGVMDLVGGLTLLGVSDDNIEKIAQKFAKLEGISRAATGAMDIFNSGAKLTNSILVKSAAAQEVLALATSQNTVATTANGVATTVAGNASLGAAVKFRALTAAMLANPFTAIAVGITAVISALVLFGDEEETAEEKTKRTNDELEKQNDELEKQITNIQKIILLRKDNSIELANELELLKAKGATDKEIYNAEKVLLDTQIGEILANVRQRIAAKTGELEATAKLTEEWLVDNKKLTDKELKQYNNLVQAKKVLEAQNTKTTKENEEETTKKLQEENNKKLERYRKFLEESQTLHMKYTDDIRKLDYELENLTEESSVLSFKLLRQLRDEEQKLNDKNLDEDIKGYRKYLDDKIISEELFNERSNELFELNMKKENIINHLYKKRENELSKKFLFDTLSATEELSLLQKQMLLEGEKEYQDVIYKRMVTEKKSKREITSFIQNENNKIIELIGDRVKTEQIINSNSNKEYKREIEIRLRKNKDALKSKKITDDEFRVIEDKIKSEAALREQKFIKEQVDIYDKGEEEKLNITKNTTEKVEKLWRDTFENFGRWVSIISSPIQQAADIISTVFDNMNDKITKQIEDTYNNAVELNNKLLGEQLISREQYDNKIEGLDQAKREKEKAEARKAFKQQKALQIVNATIQGAQAVLSAYSSGAAVPIIGPVTVGPAFAGIAAALAATQIGIISSQKFTASRGGKVPGEPSKTDSVSSLLAPGEMVINSESSNMFAPLLSMINQAGGGIPLAPQPLLSQNSSNNMVYIENGGNQVVKAYVVESELSQTQRRVERLRNNASF